MVWSLVWSLNTSGTCPWGETYSVHRWLKVTVWEGSEAAPQWVITNSDVSRENPQGSHPCTPLHSQPSLMASGSPWVPQCCDSRCAPHGKCPCSKSGLALQADSLGQVPEGSPSALLGSEDVLPPWFHWEGLHLTPGPVVTWGMWTFPRADLCSVGIKGNLESWGNQRIGWG